MIYVALLRGINVGGKNKVAMNVLKTTFERVGLSGVKTYINSGNIIFTDKGHSKKELATLLEKAIFKDFGLHIKVVIRSFDDITLIIKTLPKTWTNDQDMKSDVMFLWEDIDDAAIVEQLVIKSGIDHVLYIPGSVLWMVARKDLSKSGKMKLAGSKLYQQMTVRNVNTTRKIYDLMVHIHN